MLEIIQSYFVISIDPIIYQFGSIALRWYGLMYAVGIIIGLIVAVPYVEKKGITADDVYKLFWWVAIPALLGGRLYFVIQQPDLVSDYLMKPENIIAVWNGGMAFYGGIFLGTIALILAARMYKLPLWVLLDGAALFAAVGQIFGRIGNIINGDIPGYPTTLPWGFVYLKSHFTLAPLGTPTQPAALYEMLLNIVLLAILWKIRFYFKRDGLLFPIYLIGYAASQFLVFFARDNSVTPLFGWDPGLKQAQWTSLFVLIFIVPAYYYLHNRFFKPAQMVEQVTSSHPTITVETGSSEELIGSPVTLPEDNLPSETLEMPQAEKEGAEAPLVESAQAVDEAVEEVQGQVDTQK